MFALFVRKGTGACAAAALPVSVAAACAKVPLSWVPESAPLPNRPAVWPGRAASRLRRFAVGCSASSEDIGLSCMSFFPACKTQL